MLQKRKVDMKFTFIRQTYMYVYINILSLKQQEVYKVDIVIIWNHYTITWQ